MLITQYFTLKYAVQSHKLEIGWFFKLWYLYTCDMQWAAADMGKEKKIVYVSFFS